MKGYQRIIISRTDSIGDVVLTLPMAGMLKKMLPDTSICFLGRSYTKAVIEACEHIDSFLNWDEISQAGEPGAIQMIKDVQADLFMHVFPVKEIAIMAKKAGVPIRLGTTNRLYHWYTCNKLIRLSRKRSALHEARLNLKLIESISGQKTLSSETIPELYGLKKTESLYPVFAGMLDRNKKNIILHPKSKGSAREWGIPNFIKLVQLLPPDKCKIFISGTSEEGDLMRESGIFNAAHVTDLTGKMSLSQLMAFIGRCDSLVAASTGPLHIAAALGIKTIGIYPPIKPMHPGRWAPLGKKASYIVVDKDCDKCRKKGPCQCMEEISPGEVARHIF